jgi:predicted HAD superfamily phosphohydrolase YqeG
MPEQTGAFAADGAPLGELANWFANADRALQFISARNKSASRVRCWPHHFDMDTVLHPGKKRTIGIGMSPGDDSYRQP